MATPTRACFGKIKVKDQAATGLAVVGGINEWSLSEEAEQIDASEIGTCVKSSIAGSNSRSMSISGFWAPADGNQSDLTVGNVIDLELYPAGSGSGNTYYKTTTGGATVLSVERSGSVDGLVSLSLSLAINGSLTTTAVP